MCTNSSCGFPQRCAGPGATQTGHPARGYLRCEGRADVPALPPAPAPVLHMSAPVRREAVADARLGLARYPTCKFVLVWSRWADTMYVSVYACMHVWLHSRIHKEVDTSDNLCLLLCGLSDGRCKGSGFVCGLFGSGSACLVCLCFCGCRCSCRSGNANASPLACICCSLQYHWTLKGACRCKPWSQLFTFTFTFTSQEYMLDTIPHSILCWIVLFPVTTTLVVGMM